MKSPTSESPTRVYERKLAERRAREHSEAVPNVGAISREVAQARLDAIAARLRQEVPGELTLLTGIGSGHLFGTSGLISLSLGLREAGKPIAEAFISVSKAATVRVHYGSPTGDLTVRREAIPFEDFDEADAIALLAKMIDIYVT